MTTALPLAAMRRWILGGLVAALTGCGVELSRGLDERQANEIAALLDQAGIAADKVAESGQRRAYTLLVPKSGLGRAVRLLQAHDLPRRPARGLADTFGGSSLLPSPVEERARYVAAIAAELERSIEALPGVATARVHLALPDDVPGTAERRPTTASVLVKTVSRPGPAGLERTEVQRLVAGAVSGLHPTDVSVVFAGGQAAEPRPLVRVGPIQVAEQSRTVASSLASGALVAVLLLAVGLLYAGMRIAALRRRVRALETGR